MCSKMADNLTESDPNHHKDLALPAEAADQYQTEAATSALQPTSLSPIIWTPRFIIIFFLVLVVGLSGANMLIRGWLNGYYPVGWVLIAYTVVNLGAWICVSIYARSPWVRLGGFFGCLWAILTGFAFALSLFSIDPGSIMLGHAI